MKIKNKTAGIFAIGMILAMIVFMTTAWFSFSLVNKKISTTIKTLPNLTELYEEQDRFYLYLKESSKLAASQAFYQISKDAAIDERSCNLINNYVIWEQNCHPKTELVRQKFLEYYNQNLAAFIKNYPNKMLRPEFLNEFETEEIINSTALPIEIQTTKKSNFANYNFSYAIKISIKRNISEQGIYLEDFEEIYNKINELKEKCSATSGGVSNIECFKNLELEHWNFEIEQQGSYFFFKLKTKNLFFFNEKGVENFAPIELNVAFYNL